MAPDCHAPWFVSDRQKTHTFAKAALLTGQDIRHVAAWLGHRDLGTSMVYTEQEALDLIRATNKIVPGILAAAAVQLG